MSNDHTELDNMLEPHLDKALLAMTVKGHDSAMLLFDAEDGAAVERTINRWMRHHGAESCPYKARRAAKGTPQELFSLLVPSETALFLMLEQRAKERKLQFLDTVPDEAVREVGRDFVFPQIDINLLHQEHAQLIATAEGKDYAYVVFGEGQGEAAYRAAVSARKRGVVPPVLETGLHNSDVMDELEIQIPEKGIHSAYGFYISTRSPEFYKLQAMAKDGLVDSLAFPSGQEVDPDAVMDALKALNSRRYENKAEGSHRLSALYRNALAYSVAPPSKEYPYERAFVVFDKGHERQAEIARAHAQQEAITHDPAAAYDDSLKQCERLLVKAHVTPPNIADSFPVSVEKKSYIFAKAPANNVQEQDAYPVICMRTNTEAFKFLSSPAGMFKHQVVRVENNVSHSFDEEDGNKHACLYALSQEIGARSRYGITPIAGRN